MSSSSHGSLSRIFVHPLKSGAGHEVSRWLLGATGLVHDRGLMLVDPAGDFVTLRGTPRLVTIVPRPFEVDAHTVTFSSLGSPELADLDVAVGTSDPRSTTTRVQIWGEWVDARLVSADADSWFSAVLGRPVRLVRLDPDRARRVDPTYARPTDTVGFADGFPLLVIGSASLEALDRDVEAFEVTAERFRPNLVIETSVPWIEDSWRRIRIGGIELELVKPCARCVGINVEPRTGTSGREPLRTLAKTRTRDGQVFFGHNALHRGVGWLAVGDPLEVLELVGDPTTGA